MISHHQTLGLEEGASQEAIQEAYNRLYRELNPANNDNQEFFIEEFEKLQEAYKVLRNSSILKVKNEVSKIKTFDGLTDKNLEKNLSKKLNRPKEFIKVIKSFIRKIINQVNFIFQKKIKRILYFLSIVGILLYLFLFFQTDIDSLVISSSNENTWTNSIISNEVVFSKNDMKPFTGNLIMLKNNYSGEFVNGKKVGIHREYYSINKIMREGNYINGVKEGIHKVWAYNGQLICKVNYKNGKRIGLSKKWNGGGQLIALDYNENQILQYISYYFKYKKSNPIEGYYFPDIKKNSLQSYYNFAIVNLDGFYYLIMTNNFKSENENCNYFVVGDVKAIISNIENTRFNYSWFMCDREIEKGIGYFSINNKTMTFSNKEINYKKYN